MYQYRSSQLRKGFKGFEKLTLEDDGSVRSNQDGTGSGSSSRSSRTLRVDGDISSENDGVPSIPTLTLDPVDGVEKSSGSSVASVLGIDSLDVGVSVRLEEIHEHTLDRLGLVDDRLGSNIESTDRLGVDVELLEETGDS